MAKKILKAYQTIIYDDGTMETVDLDPAKLTPGEAVPPTSEVRPAGKQPTGRISQIMDVMLNAQELWTEEPRPTPPGRMREQEFDEIVTGAIKQVAAKMQVSPATVTDKVTRQLNYTRKQDFSYELLAYLEGENGSAPGQDTRLKEHLSAVCKKEQDMRYKDEQLRLIEEKIVKSQSVKS